MCIQFLINQETTLDVQRLRPVSCPQTIIYPQFEIFCLLFWISQDRHCFLDPSCIFVRPHVYFLLIWTHLWTLAISVWSCFHSGSAPPLIEVSWEFCHCLPREQQWAWDSLALKTCSQKLTLLKLNINIELFILVVNPALTPWMLLLFEEWLLW